MCSWTHNLPSLGLISPPVIEDASGLLPRTEFGKRAALRAQRTPASSRFLTSILEFGLDYSVLWQVSFATENGEHHFPPDARRIFPVVTSNMSPDIAPSPLGTNIYSEHQGSGANPSSATDPH